MPKNMQKLCWGWIMISFVRWQVTRLGSAYSTMDFQKDHTIGFLWEESTYCTEGGGYTIAYDKFTVEALTNGAYSYREE